MAWRSNRTKLFVAYGQRSNPHLSGIGKRVGNGGRDANDRRFARAYGWQIRPIHQDGLDGRNILESRHAIPAETRVEHPAVLEAHLFRERTAEPHDDATLNLCLEIR